MSQKIVDAISLDIRSNLIPSLVQMIKQDIFASLKEAGVMPGITSQPVSLQSGVTGLHSLPVAAPPQSLAHPMV
jgi:hypothetical protein